MLKKHPLYSLKLSQAVRSVVVETVEGVVLCDMAIEWFQNAPQKDDIYVLDGVRYEVISIVKEVAQDSEGFITAYTIRAVVKEP